MAQQRDPPAFQEYAASMMARTEFRAMSLAARGLLYTLRLECWVNGELPADAAVLARILGYPADQIAGALSELDAFFTFDAEKVRSPELDQYRAHLKERRQRQSTGGRAGAAKTNATRGRRQLVTPPATPSSEAQATRESLVQTNPDQQRKALQEAPTDDAWLDDYERASRGH